MRMAAGVVVMLIVLALVYQFFFRYEYLAVTGGVFRVDRLTGKVCIAFPSASGYGCEGK